jgi:hypothetical protein
VPGCRQRPGLCFTIANNTGGDEIGIIEHGAISMRQRIAQLSAFMDRARSIRSGVAWYAAGKGELLEKPAYSGLIL